jgi:S-adenosylmethionine hydrolase
MEQTRIVAVISDFGGDGFYIGVMKGALYHAAPACRIVDVTHSLDPQAISQGSFVLDTVFDFFPPQTVFLAVVDPGVGGGRRSIVVETGDRYYVGPDNGLLTELLARMGGVMTFEIDEEKLGPFRARTPVGRTFLGRDVFAPAAGALAAGVDTGEIASAADEAMAVVDVPSVTVRAGAVAAGGRYVDPFGNILTGITRGHLRAAFGDAAPEGVVATVDGQPLGAICDFYAQGEIGSLMAVVNSWDRVEISVRENRAIDRVPGRAVEDISIELTNQRP